jgi:hypothetical protein
MTNPISTVLDWLRAGYPHGVPPKDFYPLLALLSRTLDEDELHEVVGRVIRENPDGDIRTVDVQTALEAVKTTEVQPSDVNDVAARLAAVGWPLGPLADEPRHEPETEPESEPRDAQAARGSKASADVHGLPADPFSDEEQHQTSNPVLRVLDWLSLGYPEGIPAQDRYPLLALLGRRLSDHEIARRLLKDAPRRPEPIPAEDAHELISQITREEPTEVELERVAANLAARGWPLERA